ncbi:hypothetical protein PINS_up002262 [Pythium insidiosum]|nr:hypothetical protein PINS_up002262 [Pythium insidiosum]
MAMDSGATLRGRSTMGGAMSIYVAVGIVVVVVASIVFLRRQQRQGREEQGTGAHASTPVPRSSLLGISPLYSRMGRADGNR